MNKIEELDFSEFHPLDHNIFNCINYPGGIKRHIELWYEYQLKEWIHINIICRLRIHDYIDCHYNEKVWYACFYCGKEK